MEKVLAVIFDMDGLIFDTEKLFYVANKEVAQRRGKNFTLEIMRKMMGQKSLDAIEIMIKELGINEDPQKVLDERTDIYVSLLKTVSQPMPGLFPLLDLLEKNNIRKCIATASRKEWVKILFDRFDLKNKFEFIITGEEVEFGKPNPAIYLKAVERLNLPASICVALEDAENGIKSAKAAGCMAIAVPNEFTKGHDFSEADLIVSSLEDKKLENCFLPL